MANTYEVFKLDIDTAALVSKMSETRSEIDKLKASQKELIASNQQNSDAFTQNEVELKRLTASYNTQKNVVTQLTTSSTQFATSTEAINSAITKENKTIAEARENNKQLLTLRNQINTTTVEGRAAVTALNDKLDANNKYIKDNVSGYEKQKIGIGDYKTAITSALNETGLFGGKVQSVTQSLSGFSGIFSAMKGVIKDSVLQIQNSASATEGMTLAQKALSIATSIGTGAMRIFSLALAATGIGLVIGAVVLLIGYFKTFDPLIDKLEQGFAAMGAAVRVVQQALASLFDSTQDSSKSFNELGDNMAKAAKDAAKLKAAQQDLQDLQNSQEVANAKASQQYDELILKSKNRTLSDKERIAFLVKAEAIETANYNQRSALADKDLKQSIEATRIKGNLSNKELQNLQRNTIAYGTYLLNQGKITQDELDNLKKAELGKIAIDAESTKRLEKNQNAQDKLNDDAKAKREKAEQDAITANQKKVTAQQKIVDDGIKKNKEALDLYIAEQGTKKQSLQDSLDFEKTVSDKKIEILKKEFEAGKISKTKYESEKLNISSAYLKMQSDLAVTNADKELANYISNNQTKITNNQFLNDTLYNQEIDRLNRVSEAEAAAQTTRLQNGVISADEYATAIKAIDDKYATSKVELDNKRTEDKKAKAIVDTENERIVKGQNFDFDLQAQLDQENIRYNQELADAEKTGADVNLIKQKHAQNEMMIDEIVSSNKTQLASETFGSLATIFGKESKAGKAMAIAQTTMDTYQAATASYKAMAGIPIVGPALGAIAAGAAVASGIANVKKITSTKEASIPSRADGGEIPKLGNGLINSGSNLSIPLSNGDDTLAYIKQGEVILNKQQQARAGGPSFFRKLNVPGFSRGGVSGNKAYTNYKSDSTIDYEKLGQSIANANLSLPAPVVAVSDINYVNDKAIAIQNFANL